MVWLSYGSNGTDSSNTSIQGQRYASNGVTQGGEFQVNTYTTSFQFFPSVSGAADGDFVVTWRSDGSSGTDTSGRSIQGQRYASNGTTQGAQFQVNTYTTNDQERARVAVAADGDFVVAWHSNGSAGTDTSGTSIQSQRYASDGSTQGAQFQVNSYTTDYQGRLWAAAAADGEFVVVWSSIGSSGTDTSSHSIQGQRYASGGSAQGTQFQVNSYTTNQQRFASVAALGNDFVVVWSSYGSSGTDTSNYSVQGQRFRAPIVAPAMLSATRFALVAALMLLGAGYLLRRRA